MWLAHSPRNGVPPQSYLDHVGGVWDGAVTRAQRAGQYFRGDDGAFINMVSAAGLLHDLGKLDDLNQDVLGRVSRDPLRVPHEDAGVAQLLSLRLPDAALLAAAHHAGLCELADENIKRKGEQFRNVRTRDDLGGTVMAHVDSRLAEYRQRHEQAQLPMPGPQHGKPSRDGFARRLALSCLVDADHSDTARNYGKEVPPSYPEPKWMARLLALEQYVAGLPRGSSRDALRQRVFQECRDARLAPAIRACAGPVGSGKTTAVMAHLLRVAGEKGLRHILVVLPYTNIIRQAVKVYRKALVLPGENPEEIVAEHHHLMDFQSVDLRQLATLWTAPVIVTTAVQFFETLASAYPFRLRKLHELPGSAVFLDETHAALPSPLWPQAWRWLETWTQDWGGQLVLASGSLPRFWEDRQFVDPPKTPEEVPDLIPDDVAVLLEQEERRRIRVTRRDKALSCAELIRFVTNEPGPQLVVMNTVQSCAMVAYQMRRQGHDVLHLSTALAPEHRERVVDRVRERLRYGGTCWTLVATSCVEAGMDLSFRTGFRESASVSSAIQLSGRVSRSGEHLDAVVWDFRVNDPLLTQHPGLRVPQRVLAGFFEDGSLERLSASDAAREAMLRELTDPQEERGERIRVAEHGWNYRTVAKLCQVIANDTRTVIIDPTIAQAVRRGDHVSPRDLMRLSVQIWGSKVDGQSRGPALPLVCLIGEGPDALYAWTGAYDPVFLGYMEALIAQLTGEERVEPGSAYTDLGVLIA